SEKGTYDLLFEDCVAEGSTDAGFDLKSNRVTLLRCKSAGNTANFKLWGNDQVVMRECQSENPLHRGGNQGARHITAQWGADILAENCRFADQNTQAIVFHTEANHKQRPPTGSAISVKGSTVSSQGRMSFVDVNSKVTIDGKAQPA